MGKGLDALFVDNSAGNGAITLALNEIEPNKDQPRKTFSEESLGELADSIREHGVLQPLLVRPMPNGRYQLIAGERRWRAARMAGLRDLPVVIREMSDIEAMQLALIENLQREDLNPVEEALGYRQLIEACDLTQEKVAASVGKSRPAVANALRLLSLPEPVLEMVRGGSISPGHAKALLSLEDEGMILENAALVKEDRLTVREIERMAKNRRQKAGSQTNKKAEKAAPEQFFSELELALAQELGRRVAIKLKGEQKGVIELDFFDKDDLCKIVSQLSGQKCQWN